MTAARQLLQAASTVTNQQLLDKITALEQTVKTLTDNALQRDTLLGAAHTQLATDVDLGWVVLCGALVFFMQAGFGVLEAGAIARKNVVNILFKNILDASVAAIMFWLVGYGFAYGDTKMGVIGTTNFAMTKMYNGAGGTGGKDGWANWFFQWAFTGASATIVAGSVAERCKITAYFLYSIIISAFIYPVIVHWVWGQGWLSAFGARPDEFGNSRPLFRFNTESNGVIDFAGSGVVHAVGGFSGLMGAIALGPRKGRFDPVTGHKQDMPAHNAALMSLGTLILWFGWYGFNCGSTLMLNRAGNLAAKVAVNTTLSASAGCIVGCFTTKLFEGHFDLGLTLNSLLAGLVGVTASCATINPWMAVVIGSSSALWYYIFHCFILVLKIDDPLDAFPLHGCCGVWGLLCVGIFCTDAAVQFAGYPNINNACARGEQFGVQVVGALAIMAWTTVSAGIVFFTIKYTVGLRVTEEEEHLGLDISEHGGVGFDDPAPIKYEFPDPAATQAQASYTFPGSANGSGSAPPVNLYGSHGGPAPPQNLYGSRAGSATQISPPDRTYSYGEYAPQQPTTAYLPPADPYGYNNANGGAQYASNAPVVNYSHSTAYPQASSYSMPTYQPDYAAQQVGMTGNA